MRRVLKVTIVVGVIVGVGMVVFIAARPPARPDQRIAAEFLGVAPWRLSSGGRRPITEVSEYHWGRVRERHWLLPRCLGIVDWFSDAAHVQVDVDREMVTTCFWHPLTERVHWCPLLRKPMDQEACVARAEQFLETHSALFSSADELVRSQPSRQGQRPSVWFDWQGPGPGDLIHVVSLQISRRTGRPELYSVRLGTPPPQDLSEVRVTGEQARAIVVGGLPDNVFDAQIEVRQPWTRSPFAPIGQPVYMVNVDAKVRLEGGADEVYPSLTTYGVHATTGELLTEPYEARKSTVVE